MSEQGTTKSAAQAAGAAVLMTLAAAQFLMTLDSSVMNVSMATVANDLGTTITGIQTAITLYTLVMATLMITGGKIGTIIGRRRAFAIGCVIYGTGSFTTGLAPNLTVLIIGWSFLEGIGAALIMPAIVALVAGNFAAVRASEGLRPGRRGRRDRGGRRSADRRRGDDLRARGAGLLRRGGHRRRHPRAVPPDRRRAGRGEGPPRPRRHAALGRSASGMAVFGVLRSSEWGWVMPKPGAPSLFGISPTFWLIIAGLVRGVAVLPLGEPPRRGRGGEPLVRPDDAARTASSTAG